MSKTNIALIKFCKSALADGCGYVYGTFGQLCTATLLDQKAAQYPESDKAGGAMRTVGNKWINKRVVDCSGLIKYFMMSTAYGSAPVYNASIDATMASIYGRATDKGLIATMPDIPGLALQMPGHVGVYIGNGEVIEAQGTAEGVVKTKLAGRGWKTWAKIPGVEYASAAVSAPAAMTATLPDIYYRAKTTKWLAEVKNFGDGEDGYAGYNDAPFTAVAVKAPSKNAKYAGHLIGGGWLPEVTGYDINDPVNGYAGNGVTPLDAVRVTVDGVTAYYRVAPAGKGYYDWQSNYDIKPGMDGYAGSFGKEITKLQMQIK